MKIKMKANAFGPNGAYEEGKEYEVEDEQAKAWIEGEYAGSVDPVEEGEGKEIENTTDESQEEQVTDEVQEEKEETKDEPTIKHVGGGVWELPNGVKVKGKENAMAALEALNVGESNEA